MEIMGWILWPPIKILRDSGSIFPHKNNRRKVSTSILFKYEESRVMSFDTKPLLAIILDSLPSDVCVCLYRCSQEIDKRKSPMRNISKHSDIGIGLCGE
jgi:hypothetical protein